MGGMVGRYGRYGKYGRYGRYGKHGILPGMLGQPAPSQRSGLERCRQIHPFPGAKLAWIL